MNSQIMNKLFGAPTGITAAGLGGIAPQLHFLTDIGQFIVVMLGIVIAVVSLKTKLKQYKKERDK